jgi:predicted enzyme related to lactoylglutathione lyase
MSTSAEKHAHSIVWFGIPAGNTQRAKEFYGDLFGWKIERFQGPEEYWHIETAGGEDTPDGGIKIREQPQEPITNYVSVDSVADFSKKSRSSVVKSAWRKQRCRKWATLPSARIPRATPSDFGRTMKTQNSCPKLACFFVASLKTSRNYQQSTIS